MNPQSIDAFFATFTVPDLVLLAVVTLFAGIVRGYAGFGMSAIIITTAAIFHEPRLLVPVLYSLEVLATLAMLPKVIKLVEPRMLAVMFVMAMIGLPLGQYALAHLSPDLIRWVVAVTVFTGAAFTLSGFSMPVKAPVRVGLLAGAFFGVLSGAASVGGLVATLILYSFTTDGELFRARATAVVFFACSSVFAFGLALATGLAGSHTVATSGFLAVPMFIGVLIGGRLFKGVDIATFKKRILVLMMLLATALMLRIILPS